MQHGFALKFTVGSATKAIPYTICIHQGDNLRFVLQLHIGTNGTYKDSKKEAVVFPPLGMTSSQFDMSPVPIGSI
eukprot:12615361-Ditylum_brightwellii.AAC.1